MASSIWKDFSPGHLEEQRSVWFLKRDPGSYLIRYWRQRAQKEYRVKSLPRSPSPVLGMTAKRNKSEAEFSDTYDNYCAVQGDRNLISFLLPPTFTLCIYGSERVCVCVCVSVCILVCTCVRVCAWVCRLNVHVCTVSMRFVCGCVCVCVCISISECS